jgi:hypothetical protein
MTLPPQVANPSLRERGLPAKPKRWFPPVCRMNAAGYQVTRE